MSCLAVLLKRPLTAFFAVQAAIQTSRSPTLLPAATLHTTMIVERARQMTRVKKRKQALRNKKLKEDRLRKNPPSIPYKVQLMLKSKGLWGPPKPLREIDDKPFGVDDVYLMSEFTWKRWTLEEAINELRLHYDPSMGNKPNAILEAKVEIDMKAVKRDRYLEEFSKMVPIMNQFDRGVVDRNVLAFVDTDEQGQEALNSGALRFGGQEMISEIAKGRADITDIDHFVAHSDVAGLLSPLNNILRDNMPREMTGTVGQDIGLLVKIFARGMNVEVKKIKPELGVADEPDYGYCEFPIGTLDMDPQLIAENLDAILNKLNENKPAKRKDATQDAFLSRCIIRVTGETHPSVQYSVLRDTITDKKGRTQEEQGAEGKAVISQKVKEIKSSLA